MLWSSAEEAMMRFDLKREWSIARWVLLVLGMVTLVHCEEDPVAPPVAPRPETPTAFTAVAGDGVVLLSWERPSGATSVRIVRLVGSEPQSPSDGANVYEGTDNQYLDQGLTNGSDYNYAAFSFGSHGRYSSAARASARPFTDVTGPAPVEDVSITAVKRGAQLTWNNPTDADFAGVLVVRKPGSGCPTSPGDGEEVFRGDATSYSSSDLPGNATYRFAIWAFDASGNLSTRVCSPAVTTLKEFKNVTLTLPAFVGPFCTTRFNASNSSCTYTSSGDQGDCDFTGHGPKVCGEARAVLSGRALVVSVRMHAVETVDDWTACGFNWRVVGTSSEFDSEWQFQRFISAGSSGSTSTTLMSKMTYTDTDHALDTVSGDSFVSQWVVMGDTDDDDACNCTNDDTRLVDVQFRQITVEVWR
jgi:hypothetical protein